MSSLQLWLAIAGGLVLAAVVAYNAWQTRRAAPRQPLPETEAPADAPADPNDARREPVLDAPVSENAPLSPLTPLRGVEVASRNLGLDALIDAIAPIELDAPVSGEAALAALPATRRAGSKPFAIEGLDADTGQWEPPRAGRRYSAFQAGVQLANRTGHLNEIEFSEFAQKAQQFADAIGGALSLPDMIEEVARARELDQFASAHDAQLGFTLRAGSAAWSPGYVQQHAARLGFVAGALPGRMVLPAQASGLPPVLSLAYDAQAALSDDPAQSAIREFSLSLDVPHVPRSERPYQRMRELAIALAAAMEGQLTDDNGQPIPTEALDAIGTDLEALYDRLDAHDLAAGSPQARRLFS
ncbi:MAG: hypothetical protein Fur0014_22540 [Rubrivivax sp.]